MRRAGRPLLGALALVVLSLLLVEGCGLRTPDGVRVDQRSVNTAADDPDIRKLPPGPVPGASPRQIVRGFLEASAADTDHSFAREFLAGSSVWPDREGATVYDPDTLSALQTTVTGQLSRVRLTAMGVGSVSASGAFVPELKRIDVTYELRRIEGQWRLSFVPPGVLLTPRDLTRSYRPVVTYAFNSDRSLLIAEPGYVASDRAGLAGAALHALLTGWDAPDGGTSRGLPPGLTALGSVVVREGVAIVDLGREAFTVPPDRRGLLVSQIAASLASVPGVFTVRVLVEERPYAGGSVPAKIPPALATTSHGPAFALTAGGVLVSLTGTHSWAVQWAGGRQARPGLLQGPVAAPGGARFAALRKTGQGTQLVLAGVSRSQQLAVTEPSARELPSPPAGRYLPPQWLDKNRLLVAVDGAAPHFLMAVASDGATHSVRAPGLASLGPLLSFVVSRDGTRIVAVAGNPGSRQAYLGRISSAPPGAVEDQLTVDSWSRVPTSLADVRAVSWSGDLSLTVVGTNAAGTANVGTARAVIVALDGVADPVSLPVLPAPVTAAESAGGQVGLASAPGRPTVVCIGSRSWVLSDRTWEPGAAVRDPAYP